MPAKAKHGPNRTAAELTVQELRDTGSVEPLAEAAVVAFLSLASLVDAPDAKADLWREYRAAAQVLREVVAGGNDDDTAAFLIEVRTPVRHPQVP